MVRDLKSPVSNVDPISAPVLPTLLQDIIHTVDRWGRIDPFTEIYNVCLFHRRTFYPDSELNFPFLARFPPDVPFGHVPRSNKERSRPRADQRTVLDPPSRRHPRLLTPTLVPKCGKEVS